MGDFYPLEEDLSDDFIRPIHKRNIESFHLHSIIPAFQELPAFLRQNLIAFLASTAEDVSIGVILPREWISQDAVGVVH